jgi:hypothetical protein
VQLVYLLDANHGENITFEVDFVFLHGLGTYINRRFRFELQLIGAYC